MESIRFKLWTTIMTLVFIILTPIWYFQVVRLADSYAASRQNETEKVTVYLSNQLKQMDYTDEFRELATQVSLSSGICVVFYDASMLQDFSNARIYDTNSTQTGSVCQMDLLVEDQQKYIVQQTAVNQDKVIPFLETSMEDYPSYIYASYIKLENENYIMVTSGDVAPVGRVLMTIKEQLMMITIPVIIGASIIAFLIARSFSKPIMKLTLATKEMARGKYETRVAVDSDDEIGILQTNFNDMAEEISHFEDMRRDLIANVSHDLKTPLTMIRGYAETIKDLTGDYKEKREQQLDIIIEESDRLNALVNDILNLSKYQSGQIVLDYSNFDLNEMILGTLDQYSLLKDHQGYQFVYEPSKMPVMIWADSLRMKQVFYNILNNAINHTGDDKKIIIRLADRGKRYRVEISDTGFGIPKEELARIWDRYYKLDKSGKRRVAGTGIGLSIVKSILSAHEALFGVDSEIQKGATFWFELKKPEQKEENII